jgi:hypothetical protein
MQSRRKLGVITILILGLGLGFLIKNVKIGLIIGLMLGLLAGGLIGGRR